MCLKGSWGQTTKITRRTTRQWKIYRIDRRHTIATLSVWASILLSRRLIIAIPNSGSRPGFFNTDQTIDNFKKGKTVVRSRHQIVRSNYYYYYYYYYYGSLSLFRGRPRPLSCFIVLVTGFHLPLPDVWQFVVIPGNLLEGSRCPPSSNY